MIYCLHTVLIINRAEIPLTINLNHTYKHAHKLLIVERQLTFWRVDEDVWFVLDQHTELDLYGGSSLKQQFTCRHVAPFRHITSTSPPRYNWIIVESGVKHQTPFTYTSIQPVCCTKCWLFSGEAALAFCLIRPRS